MKCNFCGKILRGGGIRRLKEHLAGQKGNGSTCSSVPPEIRFSMHHYLEMMLGKWKKKKMKKKKEQKNVDEASGDKNPLPSEVDTVGSPPPPPGGQIRGFSGLEENLSIVVPEGGVVQPASSSGKKVDPGWEQCQILRDGVRKCGEEEQEKKFAPRCTDVISPPSASDIFGDQCVLDSEAQAIAGSNALQSYSSSDRVRRRINGRKTRPSLDYYLFTTVGVEATIFEIRVACRAKDPRPYAFRAVVHYYELCPICKNRKKGDHGKIANWKW
ncbi:hypothetical protein RJ641_036041 [Dillenia turbinata]|uniref:BED-type domain-containing protein n=1 Tax=Dillenia turbinata TaxID=194707 RepID=A0AAN8VTI2_9MAGN